MVRFVVEGGRAFIDEFVGDALNGLAARTQAVGCMGTVQSPSEITLR